jgi:HAD superfamily hydrolase (TIGR01509 family)
VDFDYSIAARRITEKCTTPTDPAKFFSDHAALLIDYELGRLSTVQFFEKIKSASSFAGTQEEFNRFFGDIFTPMEPMIKVHAELRRKMVPAFIFSNTNDLAVEHIRRNFPFFSDFDGYVLSYEHGAMKPNARLYQIVEQATGLKGADLIYIDDRLENIEAGAARGWRAILHEDCAKTSEALRQAGVLNHG